jgi:predicted alternative tryptophan synthase beta-subunit
MSSRSCQYAGLDTPARIYCKHEGMSLTRSHNSNPVIARFPIKDLCVHLPHRDGIKSVEHVFVDQSVKGCRI